MLTRLLSERQVVVLCNNSKVYLFYKGKVYFRPETSGFEGLPERQRTRYCPVWTLIDFDFVDRGPNITIDADIWPVQASSLNPVRWWSWAKQYGGVRLGMPLWNTEDLIKG